MLIPTLETLLPWIELRYDPASGPGGQNVNKVATRATLLFNFEACTEFSPEEKLRLARRLENRLSADGRLRIVAQQERSQSGNRAVAEQRLLVLLAEALHVPKARRSTRPTAAARRRRVDMKRRRGEIKRQRRGAGE